MAAPLSVPISLNLNLSNITTNCCNGSQSDCFRDCCTNAKCCPTTYNIQNARLIQSGPNAVGVEPPPGCGTSCCAALYAFFCGCCAPKEDKFAAGKKLYQESLVQRLGADGPHVVANFVNKPGLLNQNYVTLDDAKAIEKAVDGLNAVVRSVRLKAAFEEARHVDIAVKPLAPNEVLAVNVSKRGKMEPFNENQLKDDLQKLPLANPLTEEQKTQIVSAVKGAIAAKDSTEVESNFIRIVIAQELGKMGIQVPVPLNGAPEMDLIAAVQQKNLQALKASELQSLLALSAAPPASAAASIQLLAPQGPIAGSGLGQTALV